MLFWAIFTLVELRRGCLLFSVGRGMLLWGAPVVECGVPHVGFATLGARAGFVCSFTLAAVTCPLICVGSGMDLGVVLPCKFPAAWGAGILLLACMGPFVVLQVGPLLRCLTVTWTGIRHLSRVGAPVCLQVGTRGKFVVVFVAGEWLISGM